MPNSNFPCLKFSSQNHTLNINIFSGFIGIPSDGYQYVCTLQILDPNGLDLLRDRGELAFFIIESNNINEDSGMTFVKSEANVTTEETGYFRIICTLYSQGFTEELHVHESWFYIGIMVDIK